MRAYPISKGDYLKRLARIEGQIRGLQRIISEDTFCIDVLTQVNAVTAALKRVAVGLLDEHVRHCVREAAERDDGRGADEMVAEANRAVERLVRSQGTEGRFMNDHPHHSSSDPHDGPKPDTRKMGQNLNWTTGYNVVAIPLAAGALARAGIVLSPAAAVLS